MMAAALAGAAAFAFAGWAGARAGDARSARWIPFADGPRSVVPPSWAFAAAGALLGALAVCHPAGPFALAICALVVATFAAAAAVDLRCGIVPDACTLLPLAVVVAASVARGNAAAVVGSAAVSALPLAVAALLSRGRGMGWGDVKLAALAGALLGAPHATLAALAACAVATAAAFAGGRAREPLALGPYLAGTAALALMLDPSFLGV